MSEIIIYEPTDGGHATARLDGDSLWLTQEQIADLFKRERSVITKHLRNIFNDGGLIEESNVQNLHIAGSDKPVKFYNLDAIICKHALMRDGEPVINDIGFAALALLVAESAPVQKQTMIRLIENMLVGVR